MSRTKLFCATSLVAIITVACSSDEQDSSSTETVCPPGQSIACVGVGNCQGFQVCKADGTGYDPCLCQGSGAASVGGAQGTSTVSAHGGFVATSSGGAVATHSGGSTSTVAQGGRQGTAGSSIVSGSAGTNSSTSGGPTSGGSTTLGGTSGSGVCAPADMTGYTYPAYAPARRLGGSCTEADVQSYITNCYRKGICTEFQGSGAKAACGECIKPTFASEAAYGPLIRFGEGNKSLDQTNMAGCIELMGEADCAKKMMVSTLCEYAACADNCPLVPDTVSYNALSGCMVNARSTSCAAAQAAAVCITDSAHVAACTGSGFEGQLLALGRVFCVESH